MSRYIKFLREDNTKWVAYGCDHALGYFFDVAELVDEGTEFEEEVLLIEESQLFTNLTTTKLLELMNVYQLPESHIEAVASNKQF